MWVPTLFASEAGRSVFPDAHSVPRLAAASAATGAVPKPELRKLLTDVPVGGPLEPAVAKALAAVKPDRPGSLRGAREVALYRAASPSVVLVVTETGIGSGSLISINGDVLTNWHVVKDAVEVAVVFKPQLEGQGITRADARRAKVLRYDQVSDLALLRVLEVPSGARPLTLGSMNDTAVGADVHAIGHPSGQNWTYTRGVVSQIRRNYKWTSSDQLGHEASVIQTQTPINPGNSGGPLLSEEGRIVGVNTFKSEGEGLNFAVSVEEVREFLNRPASRYAQALTPKPARVTVATCKAGESTELYTQTSQDGATDLTGYDADCDGRVDFEVRIPKDKTKPITLAFDRNGDTKPDLLVLDFERDGKWDFSLHDTDYDGKWDLVGFHPNGEIKASKFERYEYWAAKNPR
jgi:S1-C subfamily serine protease